MAADQIPGHLLEIELQAAGQHRDRHLLGVCSGQNEFDVLGRLLQCFQHRVEGGAGKHVHFVDNINLEAAGSRHVLGIVEQFPHFFDPGIGRRVDFEQVDETAPIDCHTSVAHPTGRWRDACFAVERLGENPGERSLPHATGACEEISVMQTLCFQRIGQRRNHMRLANQFGKVLGTPLTGKRLIGHIRILTGSGQAFPCPDQIQLLTGAGAGMGGEPNPRHLQ